MPAVARLPLGLIVYFAPRGPNDSDAVLLDRFSVTPGASLTLRQKRKLISLPNPRHCLRHTVPILQLFRFNLQEFW